MDLIFVYSVRNKLLITRKCFLPFGSKWTIENFQILLSKSEEIIFKSINETKSNLKFRFRSDPHFLQTEFFLEYVLLIHQTVKLEMRCKPVGLSNGSRCHLLIGASVGSEEVDIKSMFSGVSASAVATE